MAFGSVTKVHESKYRKASNDALKYLDSASKSVNAAQKTRSASAQQKHCMAAINRLVEGATLVGQAEAHELSMGRKIDNEDQLHDELYTTDAHVGEFCTMGAKAGGALVGKFRTKKRR